MPLCCVVFLRYNNLTQMKKTVFLFLLLISVLVLVIRFGGSQFKGLLGFSDKSGISVLSVPEAAQVFLDNKEVGITPFEDKNLEAKNYLLKIQKNNLSWQGKVNLNPGTVTVVNRELALDIASSSGEVLTLEKGRGVTIISSPTGADIEVDGKNIGKTPVTVNIDTGEHTFNISHSNYLKRSIRAKLPANYNLILTSDLALSEADLPASRGEPMITAPPVTQTPQITIKNTPTGFLRVRDKASLNGKEITQVKPGDTLFLLEELGSWDRVRLSNGTEGFVSSGYVSKKGQPLGP